MILLLDEENMKLLSRFGTGIYLKTFLHSTSVLGFYYHARTVFKAFEMFSIFEIARVLGSLPLFKTILQKVILEIGSIIG